MFLKLVCLTRLLQPGELKKLEKPIERSSESKGANLKFCTLTMDDGTDATDMAQLAIFIRGIDDECNVIEEMASLVPLKDTTSPGWCGSVD